jgi:hypothetical protein
MSLLKVRLDHQTKANLPTPQEKSPMIKMKSGIKRNV